MTTAADAITVEHAEASRDSGRRDDPLPANRPINMNHAGMSSVDDSGVFVTGHSSAPRSYVVWAAL